MSNYDDYDDYDDPNAEVVSGFENDEEFEDSLNLENQSDHYDEENSAPVDDIERALFSSKTAPGSYEREQFLGFSQKALDAGVRRDTKRERLNNQRAEIWRRDYQEIGEELKTKVEEETLSKVEAAINRTQSMDSDELQGPKLLHDANELIDYYNKMSDSNHIYVNKALMEENQIALEKEYGRLTELADEAKANKSRKSEEDVKLFRARAKAIKEEMKIRGDSVFSGEDIVRIDLWGGDTAKGLHHQFNGDQKKILQYLIDNGIYLPKGSAHYRAHQEQFRSTQTKETSNSRNDIVIEDDFEIESSEPYVW